MNISQKLSDISRQVNSDPPSSERTSQIKSATQFTTQPNLLSPYQSKLNFLDGLSGERFEAKFCVKKEASEAEKNINVFARKSCGIVVFWII
jgi:hypothetical protein